MEGFKDGYSAFANSMSSYVVSQWASSRVNWVPEVEFELQAMLENFDAFKLSTKTIDTLSGDVAEFWHSGTFNIDAARNGSSHRSWVPRSTEFGSVDIDTNFGKRVQVKYYTSGEAAAKAQSVTLGQAALSQPTAELLLKTAGLDPAEPVYGDMVRLIADGQETEAKEFLRRQIAKEGIIRSDQVKKYQNTLDYLETTLHDDEGVSSKGLTRVESKEVTRKILSGDFEPREYGLTPDALLKWREVLGQSMRAGMSAAIISVVVSIAPEIVGLINCLIQDGELDLVQLQSTGTSAAKSAACGFVTGFVSAALVETAAVGILGETAKAIDPSTIAAVTVVAVRAISNGLKVASGKMSGFEFSEALVKDMYIATVSLIAGGIGQSVIQVPILGYMLGSFVGSAIAGVTYEVGCQALVSLCVERGFTMFGLVEQNYELPNEALKEVGIDIFELDEFNLLENSEDQSNSFDEFEPDIFVPAAMEFTVIKRGLIGVSKVGYAL